MEQKTVFLSYRRSVSRDFARSIYQDLRHNGYDCFLDVTSIDSGDFDRIILNQIAARAHFLLVLSPGSLDRCVNAGDWVRREIEEAVRLDRNIIPVMAEGVDFTREMSFLPPDLRAIISRKTGVPLPHFYFDAGMSMIRDRFLKTPVYAAVTPTPAADRSEVARRIAAADAPASAAPVVSAYTAELTVDARGANGAFTTINAALTRAPEGARITVLPGTYVEAIVLDKRVTLEGRGADKVTVIAEEASCVTMATDEAVIAGMRLYCRAGADKLKVGVYIPRGRLIVRECDITSDSLSGVDISGAGTRPYIVGCTIRDGKSAGFNIRDQGAGVIEDCQIYGNANAGIAIQTGGNPTVRSCTIRDGKSAGFNILDQGAGVIEDCQIYGNANAGIEIKTGGNPTVRGCTIRDGKAGGVFVLEQGAGVIEDCQIYGNANAGIEIKTGGNPTVRSCTIRDNQGGVLVQEQGAGVIEDCQIHGNAYAGIEIRTGGNPTARGCTITRNGYWAVRAYEGGRGTIERCTVRGNTRGAWNISADSSVTRRDNIE